MQTTGVRLLVLDRCSSRRMRTAAWDSHSAHELLYPAAVRDDRSQREHQSLLDHRFPEATPGRIETMTWIKHRSIQTCTEPHPNHPSVPHWFEKQPALGVCPYTLSPEERAAGLRSPEPTQPCPPHCCP
jgi:hypothetical protein